MSGRNGPMSNRAPSRPIPLNACEVNPLQDARALQARIAGLRSILALQLRQIDAWHERVQPATPAGRAASRLLGLKHPPR